MTSGSPDAVGSCEHVVGGDQAAATGVPPRVILEVLEGDLGGGMWKDAVSAPRGPLPTPLSTLPPTPAAVSLPARASCGEWRPLLPPHGLIGWAGRWGRRSWRLGETGEGEHRSVWLVSC